MNNYLSSTSALALALCAASLSTAATAGDSPMLLAQVYGNISQNQSGNDNNQAISIGNSDSKPAKKGKKISSAQHDSETGNTQSGNVSGSAKVSQRQGGRDNTQKADVDGQGNVQQNQSGRGNQQSISIGGGSGTAGTPSLYQNQTGVNKKQSIKVDGKKVETKEE